MTDSVDPAAKLFPKFVAELKKYAPGVHELNPGADGKLIDYAEEEFSATFPASYRRLLGLWNGGNLFRVQTMLFGIDEAEKIKREKKKGKKAAKKRPKVKALRNVEDLVESNQPESRWPGMPDHYLIIARTGLGDRICLDLKSASGADAGVVLWDHEDGCKRDSWKTLAKWLDYEMKEGKALYDYDGNLL